MPTIWCDDEQLAVELSTWESLMTGRRRLSVPTSAIAKVAVLPGWTSEPLGLRSGLAVSGVVKLGIFTHPGGVRRLVAMKRGLPVLRVGLRPRVGGLDELLLSCPDASALAERLRRSVPA